MATLMELPPQSHSVKRRGHAGRPGDGPKGETCGSCFFYTSVQSGARKHPKCGRMRAQWTAGTATDIRRKDSACKMWEETSVPTIVKIQLGRLVPVIVHPDRIEQIGASEPLPDDAAVAMIYDKQRVHMERRALRKRDLKVMGKDRTIFRQAHWTGRKWKLGDRVVAQAW